MNSLHSVENGPFTRYDPSEPTSDEKKSALDLVIISKNLEKYLISLEIDKNLLWTPCRAIGKSSLRYSDHYALICKFKNIPRKTQVNAKRIKPTIWNLKKG